MVTRRDFTARLGLAALASRALPEMAYAQRALVNVSDMPKDMVWLNANENPMGVPEVAVAAMREELPLAFRYRYQEYGAIHQAIARSEDLKEEQLITGSGSSEVLHTSVDAFTSPTRPLISVTPAYEGPIEAARALGHSVVLTKLREDYTADVKSMAEAADKAGGGMIYLCNPNNPTSCVTKAKDLDWLAHNLPRNSLLLVDEAYIHFVEDPEVKSALPYVRQGKDVIVTRTYSKIYGMAGLRVGFAAAKPELIAKLARLRMNTISAVGQRAVYAALGQQEKILTTRRAKLAGIRRETCSWLRERNVKFIEPNANFMMIDCRRDAREFINTMPKMGVAPGRPFPPLDNMLRVTIGTEQEMAKFRDVFWKIYKA